MYERGRTLSAYTTGPESDDRPFWPRHPLSRQAGKRRGWRSPKTRRGSDGRPLKATVITRAVVYAPRARSAVHRTRGPVPGTLTPSHPFTGVLGIDAFPDPLYIHRSTGSVEASSWWIG